MAMQLMRCRAAVGRRRIRGDEVDHVDDDVVVMGGPDRRVLGRSSPPARQWARGTVRSPSCQASSLRSNGLHAPSGKETPGQRREFIARTDLPASKGHLCIHVLADDPDDALDSTSRFA